MLQLLEDAKQMALEAGEKAIRLFFEIVAAASERMSAQPDDSADAYASYEPSSGLHGDAGAAPPAAAPVSSSNAEPVAGVGREPGGVEAAAGSGGVAGGRAASASGSAGSATPARRPRRRSRSKAKGKRRPDQLLRVLSLLEEGGGWMSAKELSDAGAANGTPILPGNVRKVIRSRGDGVVETRPREGSRRGALEYRITEEGQARLSSATP